MGHKGTSWAHRDQIRLRHRQMRDVYGARRRQGQALVPDAGGTGPGKEDRHDRRHPRGSSYKKGMGGRAGASVRILSTRTDHPSRGSPFGKPEPERRRHRAVHAGGTLSLRNLPTHKASDPSGSGRRFASFCGPSFEQTHRDGRPFHRAFADSSGQHARAGKDKRSVDKSLTRRHRNDSRTKIRNGTRRCNFPSHDSN